MENIKSPIYYTGNKYRLLNELKDYIPEKINTFIDVFGGSGVMAINFSVRSENVVYNEYNENIYNLFNYLIKTDFSVVHKFIEEKSAQFNLKPSEEEKINYDFYKANYYIMRDYINENNLQDDPKWYYLLSHYSFCNGITWNEKGKLDNSFGARFYKKDIIEVNLKHTQYFLDKKVKIYNRSFEDLLTDEYINQLTENDYVYLDPPYFGTKASYNKLWNKEKETILFDTIDKLNDKGVKFGLSNIFKNKHIHNTHLVEWAQKNGYIVYYPKIIYSFGGNGDSESVEVFITNKYNNYQESLF